MEQIEKFSSFKAAADFQKGLRLLGYTTWLVDEGKQFVVVYIEQ